MQNKYCMIESAFDNKEEVDKTINELLDKKLVSSCQVVTSQSIWNWNNNRESAQEYLIFMKTKTSLVKEIYDIIRSIHSYGCFEFAILNLSSNNKEYLKWIEKETK